jgi:hypothetical protein
MALIRRGETSPTQIRANRANAQKSTGPRSTGGKRQVARNASKRGLLTDLFTNSMRDLGEDPAAFGVLHRGFADSLRPANLLEEALVADLAKVWWKKARAERAQSAYQVNEIEKLEREHRQKLMGMDPDDRPGEEIIVGTTRVSQPCATNYHQVIGPLMYLLETVDKGDWLEEPEDLLDKIYGKRPTARGLLIRQTFADWLEAAEELDDIRQRREDELAEEAEARSSGGDSDADEEEDLSPPGPEEEPPDGDLNFQELLAGEPPAPADEPEEKPESPENEREEELRAALKRLLLDEIQEVTREYELYQTSLAPLTPAARWARVAPCGEWQGGRGNAWPLMLRQEASLARQFDRSLRLLLTLRGAKPGNGQIKERRKSKVKRQRAKGKSGLHKKAAEGQAATSGHEKQATASGRHRGRKSAKSRKQSRYVYENTRAGAEKSGLTRQSAVVSGRRRNSRIKGQNL